MSNVVLRCSKCGEPLAITDGMELFKCPACQTPYSVERAGRSVQIIRLEKYSEAVRSGADDARKSAPALELDQLRRARTKLQTERGERLRLIGAAFSMGGLVIGLVPFFIGSAVRSGLLAVVGVATGILGLYLGARTYLNMYYHPFEKTLEEMKQKEDELEARLSEVHPR